MGVVITEAKKLTLDPGVAYLADLVEQLTARLDQCCGDTKTTISGSTAPGPKKKHGQ